MDDLSSNTSTLKESIYAFIILTEVNYYLVEKLNFLRKKLINKKNIVCLMSDLIRRKKTLQYQQLCLPRHILLGLQLLEYVNSWMLMDFYIVNIKRQMESENCDINCNKNNIKKIYIFIEFVSHLAVTFCIQFIFVTKTRIDWR